MSFCINSGPFRAMLGLHAIPNIPSSIHAHGETYSTEDKPDLAI